MLLPRLRREIVETCRELRRRRLVIGTAGNVSARAGDLVVISPSGLDYDELTPALVGVHRLDGTPVEAPLPPSTELPLHLAVYRDVAHRDADGGPAAVVHTHGVSSSALSTVLTQLPASHYYTAMFGGVVRVARYATFGTTELARNVLAALDGRSAALLANHGAVTLGGSLRQALERAEYLEYLCEVHLRALSTGLAVRTLPDDELDRVAAALRTYGVRPEG